MTRFVYARNHYDSDKTNEGFAFNEGWAEYWATRAGDAVSYYSPPNDWEIEGNVAAELKRLSQCVGIGDARMVDVLRNHAESIHSMEDYRAFFDALHPTACQAIHIPIGIFKPLAAPAAPAPSSSDAPQVASTHAALPYAALHGVTMDTIRQHVEAGTYDTWKSGLRASILAEALSTKRAALKSALAADPTDEQRAEIITSLADVDAIERAVARGEAAPLGLRP